MTEINEPELCAYVYSVIVDDVVRYIGKGSVRERIKDHLRIASRLNRDNLKVAGKVRRSIFYNRLARALRTGAEIENRILAAGLSHEAAFALEKNCGPIQSVWLSSAQPCVPYGRRTLN